MEPLDPTVFSSVKSGYNRECDLYMVNNAGKRITQYEEAELFTRVYNRLANIEKAQSGQRRQDATSSQKSSVTKMQPGPVLHSRKKPFQNIPHIVTNSRRSLVEAPSVGSRRSQILFLYLINFYNKYSNFYYFLP